MIFVKDLIKVCEGRLLIGNPNEKLDNFSKDTRTINIGDIYIGIKGTNYDGGDLYIEALEKGAKGVIINDNIEVHEDIINRFKECFIVVVKDTIQAIGKLAKYKRSLYNIPVIGITGSVGKTSTKDLIKSVLSTKYRVLSTIGNYNNHIGLPLTLLSLKNEEICVIEMGMNNLGEIDYLSNILMPTISVITNVGTAHIGNLGSRENILKAKLEILNGMKEKKLVINNDNDLLHKYYLEHNNDFTITTYGINNNSDYQAQNIKIYTEYSEYDTNKTSKVIINTPGEAYIYNSLCAYTIGELFNLSEEEIKNGIANYELTSKRMEITTTTKYTIINDSYNANLDSMNSAIKYLGTLKGRKVAILGDMLELGNYSKDHHVQVGQTVNDNHIDVLITIGKESENINTSAVNINNKYHFNNNEEAINCLNNILQEKDIIMLKASNGMHFSEIFEALKK